MSIVTEALRKAEASAQAPPRAKPPPAIPPPPPRPPQPRRNRNARRPAWIGIAAAAALGIVLVIVLAAQHRKPRRAPPTVEVSADDTPPVLPAAGDAFDDATDIRLTGIMYTAGSRVAYVNGRVLSEGASIAGSTLVRISKDSILLQSNGTERVVYLKE